MISYKVSSNENDGAKLFEAIAIDSVVNVLDKLDGPCAIVHYDRHTQILTFARDVIGRRSLLVHFVSKTFVCISHRCALLSNSLVKRNLTLLCAPWYHPAHLSIVN